MSEVPEIIIFINHTHETTFFKEKISFEMEVALSHELLAYTVCGIYSNIYCFMFNSPLQKYRTIMGSRSCGVRVGVTVDS